MTGKYCERCGVVDGSLLIESINPLTEVHKTYRLCPDCMYVVDRMLKIMIVDGCE